MDPVLLALAFHRVQEVNWCSSGGLDVFISCKFPTGSVHGYPAESVASAKCDKVDNGRVVPALVAAVYRNRSTGVARKSNSDAERNYR